MEAMRRLRDDFMRADYSADAVLEAIGAPGQLALSRNHTIAAQRALTGRDDPLATLIRLFVLQQPQPEPAVLRCMDAPTLSRLGILVHEAPCYRAAVDIRPMSDQTDSVTGWVVSDHTAALDIHTAMVAPNHVLGISPASISLSQITSRRAVGRALDLGTGSGVQCLHLSRYCDQIVATDLNPRALTLATLTFALNGFQVSTRQGSLYEPVAAETFDVITTNPPFVISPPSGQRLVYRETGYHSDDLMKAVVSGAGPRLNPGGSLHVVGNWAHVHGQPWQERLEQWVPRGCDAYIVERERLDIYEYIEVWLADAGLAGSPQYRRCYDQWLAYFDDLGIESVGMGWVTMVKSGSETPRVVCESWPHPVTQPVAGDLLAHLDALDFANWSDSAILDRAWLLAPGAVQEITSVPGDPDPTRVVLRRVDGLQRVMAVDPGVAGILGTCDGQLSLGRILAAVAGILDQDPGEFRHQVMPEIRRLISQTWLTLVEDPGWNPGAL